MKEGPSEGQIKPEETSLTPRVPFNKLLPRDFSLVAGSPVIRAEQQEVFQDRRYTYSQALDRAENMRPTSNERRDRTKALVRLVMAGGNLPVIKQFDPLEEYRKEKGLVERREYLINQLLNQLSFERGLASFSEVARTITGREYNNMEQLNQDFPHLTKAEMILLALIKGVPGTYLTRGRPPEYKPKSEEEEDYHLIPVMAGASIEGLLFMDDTDDPNKIDTIDIYRGVGITGASGMLELVRYTPQAKRILDELISLTITNYRLHERVWNKSDSALSDGMGKLDRIALNQILGQPVTKSVTQIIDSLTPEQKKQFQIEQQRIDRTIAKVVLVDLQTGHPLKPIEVVKLFGLIHQIPPQILDPNMPFEGLFTPFGPGILFMDDNGKAVSYTPYHPYYLRDAIQGIHDETVSGQMDNRTITVLFNQLANQAQNMAMAEAEQTGEDPSILEGIKIDMKLRFNIDLEVGPQTELPETNIDDVFSNRRGEKMAFKPVIKFGVEEAQQILETLSLLPSKLLEGIKRIRKTTKVDFPLTELLSGENYLGEFDLRSGTMTLYQHPLMPYVNFSPELRAARSFTIAHEVAHALWENLTDDEKDQWKGISWNEDGEPIEPTQNFLTMYSHVGNEGEDFCDHFASFVLHGSEFREKGEKIVSLKTKYAFIKDLLSRLTGADVEYPRISPYTIEQITGAIDAQMTKLTEEQVIELQQNREQQEDILSQQARAKVITSLDQDTVEDVIGKEELESASGPIETAEDLSNVAARRAEIDFKRSSILDLRDFFSGELTERGSTRIARRIYQLLEDEKLDRALKIGRDHIFDPDDWEDFVEEVNRIKETVDSGNYPH